MKKFKTLRIHVKAFGCINEDKHQQPVSQGGITGPPTVQTTSSTTPLGIATWDTGNTTFSTARNELEEKKV
jgi:hypothetical protein